MRRNQRCGPFYKRFKFTLVLHLNNSESDKWLEAMKSEMDSMYTNQVWTLIDQLEGIKPIKCKWIFKKKTDMEGNVITYKVSLVAKGYRQR